MGALDARNITTASGTFTSRGNNAVLFLLSQAEMDLSPLPVDPVAGFHLAARAFDAERSDISGSVPATRVLVVELRERGTAAVDRMRRIAAVAGGARIIIAMRDASVADVRALIRGGATDVIALPIVRDDLEATLAHVRADLDRDPASTVKHGRLASVIGSVGGIGATVLATQMASLLATRGQTTGDEICLIDFDLQSGSAAAYLGLDPQLSLHDLILAGDRLDSALLRSAMTVHPSGLSVVAAPDELMPLEAIGTDMACELVDLATTEYATVLLDLPSNWTSWSLSLVARSDIVFLVSGLSVAALRQTRRHLDMLAAQGLADLPIQVIANRYEKALFKPIELSDAERAIGRRIDHVVANDYATVSNAINQGVPFTDIRARNRVTRDLATIIDAHPELLTGGA